LAWQWTAAATVDGSGNIIVADTDDNRISKISPEGNVSTVAGSGRGSFGDGQGTEAHFSSPRGVAVDGSGNIIVADNGNQRIRKIAAGLAPPGSGVPGALAQLPSVFAAQMKALLNDETLSDVTFVVGDTRIRAHRAILVARCEYFRAMLTSGFREGQEEPAAKRARTGRKQGGDEISIGNTTRLRR
jgi:hypothetical protein